MTINFRLLLITAHKNNLIREISKIRKFARVLSYPYYLLFWIWIRVIDQHSKELSLLLHINYEQISFCQLTCIFRCTTNQMKRHRHSLIVSSTRNLYHIFIEQQSVICIHFCICACAYVWEIVRYLEEFHNTWTDHLYVEHLTQSTTSPKKHPHWRTYAIYPCRNK